jgi:hypothetical protein
MVEANRSYRDRQKAARAQARAQRLAQRSAQLREIELRVEVRRLAREAVLTCIRANGDKVSLYTPAQIITWANTFICKWLIAKAKENIAERNLRHLSKSQTPAPQGFPVHTIHAQKSGEQGAQDIGDWR